MGQFSAKFRYIACVALLLFSILFLNMPAPQLSAATITVTTTADENSHPAAGTGCSLREAAIAASTDTAHGGCAAGSGADIIMLGSGVYTIANYSSITFSNDTVIRGVSQQDTTVLSAEGTNINLTGLSPSSVVSNMTFSGPIVILDGSGYEINNVTFEDGARLGTSGAIPIVKDISVNNSSIIIESTDSAVENITSTDSDVSFSGSGIFRKSTVTNGTFNISAQVGASVTVEDTAIDSVTLSIINYEGTVAVQDTSVTNNNYVAVIITGSNDATTTLKNVTIKDNQGIGLHHQIFNGDTHKLYIEDSLIENNQQGGLINEECYNAAGTMYITNSQIVGNSSTYGGGIYNMCGHVVLDRVTIANNDAVEGGGVLTNSHAVTDMTNTTIYGNTASSQGGGISNVGEEHDVAERHTYQNITVARNTAPTGAGIYSEHNQPAILNNVLFAENTGDQCDLSTDFDPGSLNNISTDDSCGANFTESDNIHIAPSLADNGGSANIGNTGSGSNILTLALLEGSPAINTGDNTSCPVVDARNMTRPQLSTCDVGAYEFSLLASGETPLAPTGGSATTIRRVAALGLLFSVLVGVGALWIYRTKRYSLR